MGLYAVARSVSSIGRVAHTLGGRALRSVEQRAVVARKVADTRLAQQCGTATVSLMMVAPPIVGLMMYHAIQKKPITQFLTKKQLLKQLEEAVKEDDLETVFDIFRKLKNGFFKHPSMTDYCHFKCLYRKFEAKVLELNLDKPRYIQPPDYNSL